MLLLDHVNNNNSYTRIVPYSSNKDVKLVVGGIEITYPTGGATGNSAIDYGYYYY